MKKLVTILLTFIMIFGTFAVTTNAYSGSTEYVKIKKATYEKYKKAYKSQGKLKKQIRKLEKKVALKQIAYEDAMDQYDIAAEEYEKQKSLNSWLWMNVKSLGLSYSEKTWTVPASYPSSFMINGATYKVKEAN